MIILDPRSILGHAPSTDDFTPKEITPGEEKYYLIFPRTDLETLYSHPRNVAFHLSFKSDSLLEVGCEERVLDGPSFVTYFYFDDSLSCVKVVPTDGFTAFHHRMESEGKLTKRLDNQYIEELRQGVRYWDGERFVKEPTMNRRYIQRDTPPS